MTRTIYNVVVGSSGPTVTDIRLMPLNPIPPAPVLIAPLNGEIIDTFHVDFEWNSSSYATGYVIEIANDSVFESICFFDSTLDSTTYQNPEPFDDGRYYWRCTAFNGFGYSARSEVWSFDIQTSSVLCDFVPGDANGDGSVMGNDVTYSVRYFKGLGDPPPDSCWIIEEEEWLYSGGDANGNCSYTGSDVTFLVAYFKGNNPEILWCPDTPPFNPLHGVKFKTTIPVSIPEEDVKDFIHK